jgi:hypothetical protein
MVCTIFIIGRGGLKSWRVVAFWPVCDRTTQFQNNKAIKASLVPIKNYGDIISAKHQTWVISMEWGLTNAQATFSSYTWVIIISLFIYILVLGPMS